jgi:hypothetical protein
MNAGEPKGIVPRLGFAAARGVSALPLGPRGRTPVRRGSARDTNRSAAAGRPPCRDGSGFAPLCVPRSAEKPALASHQLVIRVIKLRNSKATPSVTAAEHRSPAYAPKPMGHPVHSAVTEPQHLTQRSTWRLDGSPRREACRSALIGGRQGTAGPRWRAALHLSGESKRLASEAGVMDTTTDRFYFPQPRAHGVNRCPGGPSLPPRLARFVLSGLPLQRAQRIAGNKALGDFWLASSDWIRGSGPGGRHRPLAPRRPHTGPEPGIRFRMASAAAVCSHTA